MVSQSRFFLREALPGGVLVREMLREGEEIRDRDLLAISAAERVVVAVRDTLEDVAVVLTKVGDADVVAGADEVGVVVALPRGVASAVVDAVGAAEVDATTVPDAEAAALPVAGGGVDAGVPVKLSTAETDGVPVLPAVPAAVLLPAADDVSASVPLGVAVDAAVLLAADDSVAPAEPLGVSTELPLAAGDGVAAAERLGVAVSAAVLLAADDSVAPAEPLDVTVGREVPLVLATADGVTAALRVAAAEPLAEGDESVPVGVTGAREAEADGVGGAEGGARGYDAE